MKRKIGIKELIEPTIIGTICQFDRLSNNNNPNLTSFSLNKELELPVQNK